MKCILAKASLKPNSTCWISVKPWELYQLQSTWTPANRTRQSQQGGFNVWSWSFPYCYTRLQTGGAAFVWATHFFVKLHEHRCLVGCLLLQIKWIGQSQAMPQKVYFLIYLFSHTKCVSNGQSSSPKYSLIPCLCSPAPRMEISLVLCLYHCLLHQPPTWVWILLAKLVNIKMCPD